MDLEKSDLEKSSAPVPGWYVDPEYPGSERYWDGRSWSDQRRPSQASTATSAPSNGLAVTALVCGILGAVLGVLPFTFFLGWIVGIVAIIFGVLGRKRFNREPAVGRGGMATAGIVLGIFTVVVCLVWLMLFIAVIGGTADIIERVDYCIEHPKAVRCN